MRPFPPHIWALIFSTLFLIALVLHLYGIEVMWPNVEAGGADDLIFFAMFYSGLIALMFWLVIGAEYQKARRDQQGPPEIHEDEKGYFTREVSYSFWRGRQERTKVCPPPE